MRDGAVASLDWTVEKYICLCSSAFNCNYELFKPPQKIPSGACETCVTGSSALSNAARHTAKKKLAQNQYMTAFLGYILDTSQPLQISHTSIWATVRAFE